MATPSFAHRDCADCGASIVGRRLYCNPCAQRRRLRARWGDRTVAERFWARVRRAPGDGCWEWTGARMKGAFSYGQVAGYDGTLLLAHRLAWILTNGPIPDGLQVLHRCDNPPCCSPRHLFLGTQADNMADMVQKDRPRGRWRTVAGVAS